MSRDELAEIRNELLGFIFQQYNLLPKLSLMENVEVPLVYAGVPRGERHRRAAAALERVGPVSYTHLPPVGNALFVGIKVGRTSLAKVMPYMLMYYVAIIGGLLLVTFIPAVSTALPQAMGLM